ncbi:MAG: hypothetical protein IPM43_01770 [Actinomycetota bacterium]|nr:MAG: hypothetical protein IPM43_01770 [Actinomycetota bacterium]
MTTFFRRLFVAGFAVAFGWVAAAAAWVSVIVTITRRNETRRQRRREGWGR